MDGSRGMLADGCQSTAERRHSSGVKEQTEARARVMSRARASSRSALSWYASSGTQMEKAGVDSPFYENLVSPS